MGLSPDSLKLTLGHLHIRLLPLSLHESDKPTLIIRPVNCFVQAHCGHRQPESVSEKEPAGRC